MNQVFDFILTTRKAFIAAIDELSLEELNKIPDGFNNNIIWNFGHIVISTQLLSYVRTGILKDGSSVKYSEAYQRGTKPTYVVSEQELAELKALAIDSIKAIQADYEKGLLNNVNPFATATYGEQLNSIEEILTTTIGHDNLHFGYALAQKKLL
ncbi:DinB family protein [Pedobacter sp. MW01-1-1]|uniref:DinB family protein n=1 Tax=Pedobacter sp. MW01-1-1 TaxID=3383027 RepID=UPI003FEF8B5C